MATGRWGDVSVPEGLWRRRWDRHLVTGTRRYRGGGMLWGFYERIVTKLPSNEIIDFGTSKLDQGAENGRHFGHLQGLHEKIIRGKDKKQRVLWDPPA